MRPLHSGSSEHREHRRLQPHQLCRRPSSYRRSSAWQEAVRGERGARAPFALQRQPDWLIDHTEDGVTSSSAPGTTQQICRPCCRRVLIRVLRTDPLATPATTGGSHPGPCLIDSDRTVISLGIGVLTAQSAEFHRPRRPTALLGFAERVEHACEYSYSARAPAR